MYSYICSASICLVLAFRMQTFVFCSLQLIVATRSLACLESTTVESSVIYRFSRERRCCVHRCRASRKVRMIEKYTMHCFLRLSDYLAILTFAYLRFSFVHPRSPCSTRPLILCRTNTTFASTSSCCPQFYPLCIYRFPQKVDHSLCFYYATCFSYHLMD